MSPQRREPRPLVASPSLLRALNACAATTIKGLRGSRKKQPTLSLVALERLEDEIGARLHDDILVLLALRDPVVQLLTGIGDVNSIADAADDHPAADGFVCISVVYSDPVGELVGDAHGGPYHYLTVPKHPEEDEAMILVSDDGVDTEAPAEGEVLDESLGAFIEQMLQDARSGEWRDAVVAGAGSLAPLDPQPTLVRGRRLQPKGGGAGLQVTHPKFGTGEVLEQNGEGPDQKVLVRFADKERTMLARFLQGLEPPPET